MAVLVVDRLETVDVDEGDDESPVRSTGAVDLPLEIHRPALTSKRSGQAVKAGLLPVACCQPAIVRRQPAVVRRQSAVVRRVLSVPRAPFGVGQ